MAKIRLTKPILKQIDDAVKCYENRYQDYANLTMRVLNDFTNTSDFKDIIHSSKSRTKAPDNLRGKLIRKAEKAKSNNKKFNITQKNLFKKIHDLSGVRFLYIHTKEIELIDTIIMETLDFYNYTLAEVPVAHTWDIENQKLFENAGFETELRETMYTSVHYIINPDYDANMYCEIQVRTLTDELWGEVSHKINYPDETDSVSCQEQLLALARIASGCTRLVDSIFTTYEDHKANQ
jgi:ppGpp synthetase/RelA/SpoT-type nucleotidyltranferase